MSMIDQATKDKILDAVRIEEVVGDFVSLKRHGSNYVGLCPFHQDKNPSMSVSSTKGIFKCFSCGKAGNAVSFVMEHEHMTYPEALKYLAAKYHIEVREKEETPEEIAHRLKYDSLMIVSEFAQKYYEDLLWNNEYGRAIGLSYFKERKFSDETIKKFGLGYAHNRPYTLASAALQKGYKKEYLVDSGLCIERDSGELADRFFDRVMFPIHSISGRVIAFGGRTLRTDKTVAKYVNSPQTEIYDKSNSLYGIFQAKSAIAKQEKCILVEGYADVISMHQSGIENVVASSGTSLTNGQIRLIKRFATNVTLIYDGDEAGIKAALRGTDLLLEEGLNVKVVLLPPEDDPDSFAKSHTREEIEDYIKEHECDFITFKSDVLSRDMGSDPIQKARLINDIIQTVSIIPDSIVRNVYVEMIADRFSQKSDTIFQKVAELRERKAIEKKRFQRNASYEAYPAQVPAPFEEPYPVQEAVAEQTQGQAMPSEAALTDPILAIQEREILYYLLKFGSNFIQFGERYNEEPQPPVRVDDYIREALTYDEIEFVNPLLKKIYDEYYSYSATLAESGAERQNKINRHFSESDDPAVLSQVLDLTLDRHTLNEKFLMQLEPEEVSLPRTVPKSLLLYKLRIVEQQCVEVTKTIVEAQRNGNAESVAERTKMLQTLSRMKLALQKEMKKA